MQTYVAYYRVSTKKQGQSGLGLDAQRSSVLNFVKQQDLLVAEFCDIESGKNDQRPELLKAVQDAKEHKARLVIAKLDRLSRNMTFVSSLMDSKVSFVCADMPDANEFTIHIFAALAQQER
jgi:DNA invertase Pin-like site-specific DNA recombinase